MTCEKCWPDECYCQFNAAKEKAAKIAEQMDDAIIGCENPDPKQWKSPIAEAIRNMEPESEPGARRVGNDNKRNQRNGFYSPKTSEA